jgi:hypothetical protein
MLNDRRLFLITDISFPSLVVWLNPVGPKGATRILRLLMDLAASTRIMAKGLITHVGLDYYGEQPKKIKQQTNGG